VADPLLEPPVAVNVGSGLLIGATVGDFRSTGHDDVLTLVSGGGYYHFFQR
jgi:hypothetical protein